MGDRSAVEALISHLNSATRDVEVEVRSALGGIQGHTNDPEIRERIAAALR